VRTASLTAPNTYLLLGEGVSVSMLTLESPLGCHDCSCLRSQAKMCIEPSGRNAEPASVRRARLPAPLTATASLCAVWAVLAAETPVVRRQPV